MARVEEGGIERFLGGLLTASAIVLALLAMEFFAIYSTPPTQWLYAQVGAIFR